MLNLRSISLLLLLTLLSSLQLYGQEENASESSIIIKEIRWVLRNYEDIEGAGFTREAALNRAFRIKAGDRFRNMGHLERRMETGKAELESRRLFRYLDYEIIYYEEDGLIYAQIYVYIVDRWNIAAFPRASYDSNLGFQYGGRIMYKNAFGSLIDLDMFGYWSENQWQIMTEISNLDVLFFQGSFIYHQEYEVVYQYNEDEVLEEEYSFQTSKAQLRMDFPLAPGLSYYVMPGYLATHSFDVVFNQSSRDDQSLIDEESVSAFDFSHGVLWDEVEWTGNVRGGYKFGLHNRVEIPLESLQPPQVDVDFLSSGYVHLGSEMELAMAFSSFYVYNGIRHNAGDKIRGVKDHLAYGNKGVYLNSGISVQSLLFPPVLEVHLQPFFDLAYLVSPNEELAEEDNLFMAGGFSIIFFPLPLSNLQISVVLGYDLLTPGPQELGIYTGLFF